MFRVGIQSRDILPGESSIERHCCRRCIGDKYPDQVLQQDVHYGAFAMPQEFKVKFNEVLFSEA